MKEIEYLKCTIRGLDEFTNKEKILVRNIHKEIALNQSDSDNFKTLQLLTRMLAPMIIKTEEIKRNDSVNHPAHYTSQPVECIEFTEHLPSNLANVLKYIWRRKRKGDELENLKKALWYLRKERERVHAITKERIALLIEAEARDTFLLEVIDTLFFKDADFDWLERELNVRIGKLTYDK